MSEERFLIEWTKCKLVTNCDKCIVFTHRLKTKIPLVVLNWHGKADWENNCIIAICELLKPQGSCVNVEFVKCQQSIVSSFHTIFTVDAVCTLIKCSREKHLTYYRDRLILVKHVDTSESGFDQRQEEKKQ